MEVEPVEPTYARTLSKLLTVMAVMYERMTMPVVMTAKRMSDMSSGLGREGILLGSRELLLGLPPAGVSSWFLRPLGRHFDTASTLARQGWT